MLLQRKQPTRRERSTNCTRSKTTVKTINEITFSSSTVISYLRYKVYSRRWVDDLSKYFLEVYLTIHGEYQNSDDDSRANRRALLFRNGGRLYEFWKWKIHIPVRLPRTWLCFNALFALMRDIGQTFVWWGGYGFH